MYSEGERELSNGGMKEVCSPLKVIKFFFYIMLLIWFLIMWNSLGALVLVTISHVLPHSLTHPFFRYKHSATAYTYYIYDEKIYTWRRKIGRKKGKICVFVVNCIFHYDVSERMCEGMNITFACNFSKDFWGSKTS
jgi:hypothetical protein